MLTITVNTLVDEDNVLSSGGRSLREAINEAQAGELINFESGLNGTITLTHGALPTIAQSQTIDGSGHSIVIQADTGSRIFNITDLSFGDDPPLVTMIGLTLTGGNVSGEGGAIRSEAFLVLQDCTIEGNEASNGGGVFVEVAGGGTSQRTVLEIQSSRIEDNVAGANGGGVWARFSSATNGSDSVLISNSNISHNDADNVGGGLFVSGLFGSSANHEVVISATTLDDNHAGIGGSIYFQSAFSRVDLSILQGSKITGSTATSSGGGIYVSATDGSLIDIEDSTIAGNTSDFDGGGIIADLVGGASLKIQNSVVSGNTAGEDGGGIFARALSAEPNPSGPRAIAISRSHISGNTAYGRGGGIYAKNYDGNEALIEETTVTHNYVPSGTHGHGGGVYAYLVDNSSNTNRPKFTITGSTIDHNETLNNGGGVFVCIKHDGDFVMTNSTVSDNQTLDQTNGKGGGIYLAHPPNNPENPIDSLDAHLRNVTITQNISATGGGVQTLNDSLVRVRIANSIVSENFTTTAKTTRSNLAGRLDIANTKYNLVGSGSTILNLSGGSDTLDSTNITGNNTPLLGPLQNNGGPTWTHALLEGSEAIDAGSNDLAEDPLTNEPFTTDQRGTKYLRKVDITSVVDGNAGYVDIGAYEIGLAKIIDVILDRVTATDSWARDPYSFAELVPEGKQLAPIYTQGVNTVQIAFSENLGLTIDSLKLLRTGPRHGAAPLQVSPVSNGFQYVSETRIATWTFPTLTFDKYRIEIVATGATGLAGLLDGEWNNIDGPQDQNGMVTSHTLDDWTDDPKGRTLRSGDAAGVAGGNFEFLFAYLPGDYNQNGVVDEADHTMYTEIDFKADGNGDNVEDEADYNVWASHFNEQLAIQLIGGDYDDNYFVGMTDYSVWRATYGSTTELGADGNGNGIVDGADYTLWRYWENTQGAWYPGFSNSGGSAGFGSLLPIVDLENAPTVVNVTISGSNSTHAAYSFDAHDGSGEQLRTVPVGGADTISITFSEDVNVVASNLRVVGLRTINVPTLVDFAYDIATMTATWRFDDVVANDHYLISLTDAVTDITGARLDGEWVNPVSVSTTNTLVSEFPSGDGHAGGNFNFVFTLLAADADLDNLSTDADADIWQFYYAQDGSYVEGDYNGDGIVGSEDYQVWLSTEGTDMQSMWAMADLDGDFDVDDDDLAIFNSNLGMSYPTLADGDFNHDNQINSADLDFMFAQYGIELAVVS